VRVTAHGSINDPVIGCRDHTSRVDLDEHIAASARAFVGVGANLGFLAQTLFIATRSAEHFARCFRDGLIETTRTDELWVKRKVPTVTEGLALS
jgi:hypothetical protein